jgi:hypothetical protein
MTTKQRIATKFQSIRQSRKNVGDQWEITLDEWQSHFADPKQRRLLFDDRLRYARVNAVNPWTLDNLCFREKQAKPVKPVKAPKPKKSELPKPSHAGWNTLTVADWIVELRETARNP